MADVHIKPGKQVRLSEHDANAKGEFDKATLDRETAIDERKLGELQELLYAASHQAVLVVLQGIDTSGKDGTTNHVFSSVNVMGCRSVSFKQPSSEELSHDYLWRIHQQCPRRGEMVIFNRSHYESVLVERVHKLVPVERWQARFEQINNFEAMLTAEGTIILKFFLNISKDEQEKRLRERMTTPDKRWKVGLSDWAERKLWDAYQVAYEEMLSRTSTDYAPWYVIPANRKHYRNYLVSSLLVDALEPHRATWQTALNKLGESNLQSLKQAGIE